MEFISSERDTNFILFEYLEIQKLIKADKWKEFDLEMFKMVISEAVKVASGVLAPICSSGDEQGVKHVDGKVLMPDGYKEAYEKYCEGGWLAISNSPEWGGQGFPESLSLAAAEAFVSANCSLTMCPGLTRGSAHLIESFGTDELKAMFVEQMYSGQWSGTMCLTEPQAGSAVGDVKTMATPNDDGTWSVVGTKSFITFGDHDMTENIVHLVLAKTPGAPEGIKGISLLAVPKFRVNQDGSSGEFNDVTCTNIEHKMGIHSSPTCTLNFGDEGKCLGYLVGEQHKGIMHMFQMMNEARVGVGMQGMSQAALAYQLTLKYTKERVQGTHILSFKDPNAPRIEIIKHPDVLRMLMTMKSYVEGSRVLLYSAAFFSDMFHMTGDESYQMLLELLTPICKAYCTDVGFRVTDLAIQAHGGYGYCSEYGVEQLCRDQKITAIYEGTNGIQALDLVGRKLSAKGGMYFMNFLNKINVFVDEHKEHPTLKDLIAELDEAKNKLAEVTMHFGMKGKENPIYPISYATPYLEMFGEVTFGFLLLEMAVLAQKKLEEIYAEKGAGDTDAQKALLDEHEDAAFYHGKVQSARFFITQILPGVYAKARSAMTEDISMLDTKL